MRFAKRVCLALAISSGFATSAVANAFDNFDVLELCVDFHQSIASAAALGSGQGGQLTDFELAQLNMRSAGFAQKRKMLLIAGGAATQAVLEEYLNSNNNPLASAFRCQRFNACEAELYSEIKIIADEVLEACGHDYRNEP